MRRLMDQGILALFAVAAFTAAPTAVSANLLTNGGFELPGAPSGSYSQFLGGSTGINGWTVTGADVLVLNTTYIESGIAFNANSGSNSLDITGAGNTGPADGVFQTLATSASQNYVLSFYVGRGDDGGQGPNYSTASTIGLAITGASSLFSGTFTNTGLTSGGVNWALFTVNFTSDSASTTITFTNATLTTSQGGNNFAGLDDVSLETVVPEPSTLISFGLGSLSLIGFVLRRRRATTI